MMFRAKTAILASSPPALAGRSLCLGVLMCALSFATAEAQANASPTGSANSGQALRAQTTEDTYKLDVGDKLRVIVFGETDLGGEFQVDDSGFIRLPLIGQIRAAGLGLHDFENSVTSALEEGYLKNPKVSIEVINYRPFYILGQVNKPGEYPFVNGMSVLNAVALAGGYTYRASESNIYVRRKGTDKEQQMPADQTTKVFPGDIVRIPERFF
jgi:protein involved in polysaccharide export with SLBB domain